MDYSAGGMLSPSESDLTGPNGPYVTGGPVGQIGTLSPSTSSSEILVDPGGTLPSADHAGMLLPAMPVGPVGRWGTLPPSNSDLAGPDDPSVTGGPVGQLGTLSPSTFTSAILVDRGGTLPSADRARMLLPAIPVGPIAVCYWWPHRPTWDVVPVDLHVGDTGGPGGGGRCRHPTSPGCCSRLYLLALLTYGGHCPHLILTLLARMARMLLVVPLATLGRCPRLPPSPGSWWILVGCFPLPGVDVPGLCQIVSTGGLLPGVAVPLPVVWDPLFALSPVEELKGPGAEVVGRSLAVRSGWSDPDVAGTSAVVANIGAPSDRAVGCPAWDGGCHREMVDDWTIYELTIHELMMVVVYMFCAYVLLCIFCGQGFSRFASLSGVCPHKLVWGIVRSFLGFKHVRAGGGSVTIGQYRYSLGWTTIGRGGLRALWHVYRGLSWPTIALFGRLPRQPSAVCVWHIYKAGRPVCTSLSWAFNEAVL